VFHANSLELTNYFKGLKPKLAKVAFNEEGAVKSGTDPLIFDSFFVL
jgi:hypothetical protein